MQNNSSSKKIFIIIAIVITLTLMLFGLLYFLDVFAGPGMEEANQCLAEATEAKELTIQRMEQINSREQRVEIYCASHKVTLNKLKNCLNVVKQENSLSMNIFEAFPKISKSIKEDFDTYNKACPSTPMGLE